MSLRLLRAKDIIGSSLKRRALCCSVSLLVPKQRQWIRGLTTCKAIATGSCSGLLDNSTQNKNPTTCTTSATTKRYLSSSVLSKEAATAPIDTPTAQRWWAVPPANAVHIAIGSVYVYSMWTPGMTTALGVVTSAPILDWTPSQVLPVFSTAAVTLGITTSTFGNWVEQKGPRTAGMMGSVLWGSALVTTAAGIHFHSLPLVYAGYGVLGGMGWGLMYLAPVTTVMKWYPDRRGLATGLALSAFGAGAAIAPLFIHTAMEWFAVPPDFIGTLADVSLQTLEDGSQIVSEQSAVGVPGQSVVVATEADIAKNAHLFGSGSGSGDTTTVMSPGVYALGTGNNGTSAAMASLGIVYGALGALGSRFMRLPHPNWTPTKSDETKKEEKDDKDEINETGKQPTPPITTTNNHDIGLPVDYVTRSTIQFPLLWLSVFGNATGGLALLSSSKLMLTDIWQGIAPTLVTPGFCTAYVSALGAGMAIGRFGWSTLSDYLGRQQTYLLFGLSMPIVGMAPTLCHVAAQSSSSPLATIGDPSTLLYTWAGGSILALSFYGGVFSVLPAYIADLFGQKHAGAIHGKALTAWAASAVAGPMGLAMMRQQAVDTAIHDLIGSVQNEQAFVQAFGCPLDDADRIQTLMDAKTITISRLLEIVPSGTVDPTPFLYDQTCYAAAGLMGIALLANMAIRPLPVQEILKSNKDKTLSSSGGPYDDVRHQLELQLRVALP